MDNISETVLYLRRIPGWLIMVEDHLGSEFADKCEAYDEALIAGMHLAEEFWYEVERQRVREGITEWKEELSDFAEECRERRRKESEALIDGAKQKLSVLLETRGQIERKREMLDSIVALEKRLKSDITPEQIEQAQNYPLENLLTITRGMALCIEHDDHTPSMNCKNNYCYCHTCGFHADPIGVYMKLNNCGFKESVKSLV